MKTLNSYIELKLPSTKLPKLFHKVIPLWMVVVITFNTTLATGVLQYFIVKNNFNLYVTALAKTTKSPEELVQILKQEVIPQTGYTLSVRWNDIGKQLLVSGVIDKAKYEELYQNDLQAQQNMSIFDTPSHERMAINEDNARFMVNTLWAFGLVNQSQALTNGVMQKNGNGDVMSFASTGGWTLGAKTSSELYSSKAIVSLTPKQEELVKNIAQNIFRPCCNNSTYFPDCNHGMAALGYIELAVKQGVPENRIYKDVLALNSYWFPPTYVEQAVYNQKQGTEWGKVDAKSALSAQYSSVIGAQRVNQEVQYLPGVNLQGGCTA